MDTIALYSASHKRSLSKKTLQNYLIAVKSLFAAYPGNPADITKIQVIEWLDSLTGRGGNPASPATYNQKLAALNHFFGWCKEIDLIDGKSPTVGLKSARITKAAPKDIKKSDIEALLLAADCCGVRIMAIVHLLLQTGLRAEESLNLNIENVEGWEIIVECGKGSKERKLPISHSLRQILDTYISTHRSTADPTAPLFVGMSRVPGQSGKRLTYRGLHYIINEKLAKTAACDAVTPHQLRHTFATLLLEKQIAPGHLQTLLGHSTLGMTQRYTAAVNATAARDAASTILNEGLI